MTEITQKQLDLRFSNRRKMAWRSFYYIVVFSSLLVGYALGSDEAAARVALVQWIVLPVGGMLTSIVLAYFGVSAYEQGKMK